MAKLVSLRTGYEKYVLIVVYLPNDSKKTTVTKDVFFFRDKRDALFYADVYCNKYHCFAVGVYKRQSVLCKSLEGLADTLLNT